MKTGKKRKSPEKLVELLVSPTNVLCQVKTYPVKTMKKVLFFVTQIQWN